ncbi:hypothetical protein R50073_09240 [Maricurvus nonylphenolicus]|uniref:glutathione S-transferase family protein n=1 Tax=Maricurvus nonylphenolicus TaxID=1008307 RepID=UPI0036F3CF2B
MPFVTPTTKEVTEWQGFHLFHYGMSYCSQRVRIFLNERDIPWTSHIVDIPKEENLTEWYQGINPNAVVPTLVHDGQVLIESSDILKYLKQLSDTRPQAAEDLETENAVIALSDARQTDFKILSFQYLFKPMAKKNAEQLETLNKKLKNRELYQFHKSFSSAEGLPVSTIRAAVWQMQQALTRLENILSKQPWLSGGDFGIADTTWAVNIHRLELLCFPMAKFPHLRRWFKQISQRPSYQQGLLAYEPAPALKVLKFAAFFRANIGKNSIRSILAMDTNPTDFPQTATAARKENRL